MYIRKSKDPKIDSCGTPHVILEILDVKPLIDTICLRFDKHDSNHLFANPLFHDIICSTECYDPQYDMIQKPSEGQQKHHMQSYHHQQLLLLPQSDLTEHMKLNNATKSQTEGNI